MYVGRLCLPTGSWRRDQAAEKRSPVRVCGIFIGRRFCQHFLNHLGDNDFRSQNHQIITANVRFPCFPVITTKVVLFGHIFQGEKRTSIVSLNEFALCLLALPSLAPIRKFLFGTLTPATF